MLAILHIQKTYLQRKHKRGGTVKIDMLVANPIEKSRFGQKNMILPYVPGGHFVLGTLLEACLKDVVFDVNARQQKITKMSKFQNCHLFDMKMKTVA